MQQGLHHGTCRLGEWHDACVQWAAVNRRSLCCKTPFASLRARFWPSAAPCRVSKAGSTMTALLYRYTRVDWYSCLPLKMRESSSAGAKSTSKSSTTYRIVQAAAGRSAGSPANTSQAEAVLMYKHECQAVYAKQSCCSRGVVGCLLYKKVRDLDGAGLAITGHAQQLQHAQSLQGASKVSS